MKGTIFKGAGYDGINVSKSKVGGMLGEGENDVINIDESEVGTKGSFYCYECNQDTG